MTTTLVATALSDFYARHRWEEQAMPGYRTDRQVAEFGEHVRGWRMVLGLTAQQVAERAGITRDTLRKIETGDSSVSFRSVTQVLRALGVLDQAVEAVAPLRSDIGRLRADKLTKKRAR
jgi:transcriptional regulator with XRE-family HTH domain